MLKHTRTKSIPPRWRSYATDSSSRSTMSNFPSSASISKPLHKPCRNCCSTDNFPTTVEPDRMFSFLAGQEITFRPLGARDYNRDLMPTDVLAELRAYARTNTPCAPKLDPATAEGLEAAYPQTAIRYRRHWTTEER